MSDEGGENFEMPRDSVVEVGEDSNAVVGIDSSAEALLKTVNTRSGRERRVPCYLKDFVVDRDDQGRL